MNVEAHPARGGSYCVKGSTPEFVSCLDLVEHHKDWTTNE